ncbi:PHD-type domain-containing protein [Aphelenchoides besseyi]|nr:PHD-type domain-containing protein [Aphelenchoides besseyi]
MSTKNDDGAELLVAEKPVEANGIHVEIIPTEQPETFVESNEQPEGSNEPVEDEQEDEQMDEDEELEDEEPIVEEPKAKVVTQKDHKVLYSDPSFAEICSFFNTFGSSLGLKFSFEKLERMLCTYENGKVTRELIDLQLSLMRKVYMKWARIDKFEMCMEKFCEISPALDAEISLEIKRFGYDDLPMNGKLSILKALCESQFDFNYKFKETVFHTFHHFELRLSPIGYDRDGCGFYFQKDFDLNLRVYSIEPDDQSGASWTLRAKSLRQLYRLIQDLKNPNYEAKVEDEDVDLDEDNIVQTADVSKSKDEDSKDAGDATDLSIEMSNAERELIQMFTKKCTFWDIFQTDDQLNKKVKLREERRKNREAAPKTAPVESIKREVKEQSEEVEEEQKPAGEAAESEEEDLSAFMEDRRILPRRSARNNAINNLKSLLPTRRKPREEKNKETAEEKSAEQSEESSENEDYESEDEEEEGGSSDEEFIGTPSRKPGKRKRKSGKSKAPRKPRSAPVLDRKRAPKAVAFDEESTDDDEVEESQKERRKATEKTLCMKCHSSKRPDVLLLCDICDDAWHIWCLKPPLHFVPPGDWFCPKCHHSMLIQKLSFAFIQLQELQQQKEKEEQERQIAEAELKRRNELRTQRGLDLRNIIAKQEYADELDDSPEETDDGQRKSKRRALKRVLKRTGGWRDSNSHPVGPVMTIAEGRSRRQVHKVDYNFQAYDEQLQEAMDAIDSPPPNAQRDERPNGLGLGKDMANIYEAEERRRGSVDEGSDQNDPQGGGDGLQNNDDQTIELNGDAAEPEAPKRQVGQPPKKKARKSTKKLTDLDVDNRTESSDSEEFEPSESELEEQEDDVPSEDEYIPSEEERRRSRPGGGRKARTQSDDEFINDEDSDSDFNPGRSKKRAGAQKRKVVGRGGRGAKRRKWSDSEEETDESDANFESDSSFDDSKARKRKAPAKPAARKWDPKGESSSEEEEVEMEYDEDSENPRPSRRAAKEVKNKIAKIEKEVEDEEFESDEEPPAEDTVVKRAIGQAPQHRAPTRNSTKSKKSDDEEFQPSDSEVDEAEENDEEEEIEEEIARELKDKREKQKQRKISVSDESDGEDEKPVAPKAKPMAKAKPIRKSPPKPKVVSSPDPPEDPILSNNGSPVAAKPRGRRPSRPIVKSQIESKTTPRTSRNPRAKNSTATPPTGSPATSVPSTSTVVHHAPAAHAAHSASGPVILPIQRSPVVALPPQYVGQPYALPPHVRPVAYVQQPPAHMLQHGHPYDYYSAPPHYLPPNGPPPTSQHAYQAAHLPPNSYQFYTMPTYTAADQSQVTQLQPMRSVVDPDSLGGALAGAINPDVL